MSVGGIQKEVIWSTANEEITILPTAVTVNAQLGVVLLDMPALDVCERLNG